MITRLLKDEDGQDLIEYGILLLLVAISLVLVIPPLTSAVANAFAGFANDTYNISTPDNPH